MKKARVGTIFNMKVKELIAELQNLDPEVVVVMSSDSEGNGYSPIASLGEDMYIPETTYSGSLAYTKEDFEADPPRDGTYEEYLEENKAEKCVALWPTN